MKKILLTGAVALFMTSTAVYANNDKKKSAKKKAKIENCKKQKCCSTSDCEKKTCCYKPGCSKA